ncbi:MAG: cobalt-precorrin-5B (C(1))-methyltransferase [Nitrospiraceae bacterium]|nr:MAG: cobalt-precorrin-5B (C(1))-methyltransferase [Nitrospiraceae bacterium]
MKKNLRSGYTTGACAAAAAKAATTMLLSPGMGPEKIKDVAIPFPDGSRVAFKIHNPGLFTADSDLIARASVIKDAGDDPDVTNGAEIMAEVKLILPLATCSLTLDPQNRVRHESPIVSTCHLSLRIKGGKGVGIVTKPGLPVPVGEHAINPGPGRMIEAAVREAVKGSLELRVMSYELKNKKDSHFQKTPNSELSTLEVTISVPRGEELAKKTLNARLGITGGISILGTTGIVRPVSAEAWTATITSSMDVARAMGHYEIVLSAGRTSEKAHMAAYGFPEEKYVLIGDYLEFSLREAKKHGFEKIRLCAQWAKMVKIAMATPQTHVRFGAIDMKKAVEFLNSTGTHVPQDREFNTAREIFDYLNSSLVTRHSSLFSEVCAHAKKYAEEISGGVPVIVHLVSYEGKIIADR